MSNATGWFKVEGWRDGQCVYWTTSTQRRGVWSAVQRCLADYQTDTVYIASAAPGAMAASRDVAQVTSGGIWRWQVPETDPLRSYIAERQAQS